MERLEAGFGQLIGRSASESSCPHKQGEWIQCYHSSTKPPSQSQTEGHGDAFICLALSHELRVHVVSLADEDVHVEVKEVEYFDTTATPSP